MTGTRLRTWLLVAGLTALLIAAGALVGGVFLYVVVGLAVAMTLFSTHAPISERIRRLEGYEASHAAQAA
jgi:Zn-dependent protease with chaperone function